LKIGKINSTCGCTVPKLEKKDYAPGERGSVKVKFHASSRDGSITKNLYVNSNDQEHSRVKLTVKAVVVKLVDFEPKKINLSLIKENAGCPEIKFKSLDGKIFSIRAVKSSGDCIAIDYDPTVKGTEFVFQPKVNVDNLQKILKGQIDFALTHPLCKNVTVPFDTLPRFNTNPASLIVFNAKPSEPVRKELWVLSNYDEDFKVISTSSKNDAIEVLGQEKTGNRYKFQLQITPPPIKSNKRMFTDTFTVSVNDGTKLNVACRGFYQKNGK
jgi:hypothetical protein